MDRRLLHPLERFKRDSGMSYESLSALFGERGWDITSKGVRYIALKQLRPSWELCVFIADKILDGASSAQELRDWPLVERPGAKAKDAA